ncbi:MAG: NAD(P)-dependent oxidoreductase [Candidatus Chloroheliales bacterium]|nr:MAG: NAD(P)-dependent oxidoreductase [Chloroflexota bacterium]
MILIAGGSGRLGSQIVRLLTGRGLPVRILARDVGRAGHLQGPLVEIVSGDVRDIEAIRRAMTGVDTVISAVHGFVGTGDDSPRTVDGEGNSNLIRAAQAEGVAHFILMSILGAAPDHPTELFRMKYQAEQQLRASGLAWTIIRPSAYMETWADLIGQPLVKTGKTQIFGRGDNPINFVSVYDVARYVELAVVDPAMRGVLVEVGGPENLNMRQVVQKFEMVLGKAGTISAIPRPMMRLMAVLMRPVNPRLARQIQIAIVMDTADMAFDPTSTQRTYPAIALTSWSDVIQRDYLNVTLSAALK